MLSMPLLLATCIMGADADPPKASAPIAILRFDLPAKDRERTARGELLADLLTAGIASRFTVVERKEIQKILAEQKLNLSGLVAPEQAVKAGKLLGARYLVAGKVTRLDDQTVVIVRVISVETSAFKGVTLSFKGEPELPKLAEKAAAELNKALPEILRTLGGSK
jgi:TolB-like protein